MQSSRAGSLVVRVRMMGWAVGLTTIMLGHGCFIQETNLNYCSNINGNFFCELRHGDQRPFCLYGSDACFAGLPAEQHDDPSFDGCMVSEPPSECYSPCGGGKSNEELSECVEGGEETGLAESGGSDTEEASAGGTTSEISADGTSTTSSEETSTGAESVCGNRVLEVGEGCDGIDLGGQDCQSQGFFGGVLVCSQSCEFDVSECSNCGDGVLEAEEECDGAKFGDQSCQAQGFAGGSLACSNRCTLDVSGCDACGNGFIDEGEQCDRTDLNGTLCEDLGDYDEGVLSCGSDCLFDHSGCVMWICGNGIREGEEFCDGALGGPLAGLMCQDLGFDDGDLGCSADCSWFDVSGCQICGNGVVEVENFEVCDGVSLAGATCVANGFSAGDVVCASDCQLDLSGCYTCGNGEIEGPEICDGSNLGGWSCGDLGLPLDGELSCNIDCMSFSAVMCVS